MTIDAQEWLAAHPAGGFDEPRRGFGVVECVPPGGMCEDGAIMGRDGERIEYGRIYLSREQAINAQYYGWKPTGTTWVSLESRNRFFQVARSVPSEGPQA